MCFITMGVLGTALGLSSAAIASATAASTAGVSALGIATGVANAAIGASIIGGIASGIAGGVSAYQQGKQQEAYYNYQADVAKQNAQIAENNAATERQQGIEESRLQRMKVAASVGSQQAAMAANGLDITQGTPLDVIQDTATMGELDALQTQYNYEKKALAYEAEAGNYRNQANLDIIAGQNASTAGTWNALNTGLAGLNKTAGVASKWFSFTGTGTGSGSGFNKKNGFAGLYTTGGLA